MKSDDEASDGISHRELQKKLKRLTYIFMAHLQPKILIFFFDNVYHR